MAQLVKNLSTMRETWVQALGQEDPLEKGKATHSGILRVHGVAKSRTRLLRADFLVEARSGRMMTGRGGLGGVIIGERQEEVLSGQREKDVQRPR